MGKKCLVVPRFNQYGLYKLPSRAFRDTHIVWIHL